MAGEMETLARYMVHAREASLPPEVAVKGKHHILDTIAAMVSGAALEPGKKAIEFAQSQGGTGEAQVLSTPLLTTAVTAAMANGFLAHADETDDSHAPSGTHPGCAIVPAAMAMGERNGVSGRRLLNAVALGYDMCARVMHSLGERYTLEAERGFSSHSLGGVFGAATAAGACTETSIEQMRYLISYTAQQTSGIPTWARDTDHIEKAFDFAGMPARSGVTAAVLVDMGFTGVWDVFEGERNFFRSFSPSPSPGEIVGELAERYELLRTNIKKHCVGSPIQAAADALGHILDAHPLRPDEVEHIRVTMGVGGARTVNNREMPNICLQHMMAVYLVDGGISFAAAHDYERFGDPAMLAIRDKVELIGDDALVTPESPRQAIVEVTTTDGATYSDHVVAVRGTMENPMTTEEVEAKARDLLVPALGAAKADGLIAAVRELESVGDVRELRGLLGA
ncbi:MAG: MmgE/PrpD family protein [Chloroflexota bacterium]|nr:MmgE/PrpD family protein [Chloroflexota bacterium]MDE2969933.1 MmgE/PrpD family protein [Chloroflexota bacterium]